MLRVLWSPARVCSMADSREIIFHLRSQGPEGPQRRDGGPSLVVWVVRRAFRGWGGAEARVKPTADTDGRVHRVHARVRRRSQRFTAVIVVTRQVRGAAQP